MHITNQRRQLEVGAAIITGVAKIVVMNIWMRPLLFIILACGGWFIYIIYRNRTTAGMRHYWGLTFKGFKKDFLYFSPWVAALIISSIFIGKELGTSVLNPTIIPILLLYPLWGIIQQFLVLNLVAQNLQDMQKPKFGTITIITITALAFSIIHFPYWELIAGTFLMAIVYTWLYLRGANLLVLGIFHGWLGAFFLYTLLGRDAFSELVYKLAYENAAF